MTGPMWKVCDAETSEEKKTKSHINIQNIIIAVHLIGKYENRIFDDRETSFNIGEIPDDDVISGIQTALLHFGKGETSR